MAVVEPLERPLATVAQKSVAMRDDVVFISEAEDEVGFREVVLQFCFITLGEAASDDQATALTVYLEVSSIEYGRNGFFLGGLDESAGVDDNDVRFGCILGHTIPIPFEQSVHAFRIDRVLWATKRY